MRAHHDGECHLCGRPIAAGQDIATVHGEWVHAACASVRWAE